MKDKCLALGDLEKKQGTGFRLQPALAALLKAGRGCVELQSLPRPAWHQPPPLLWDPLTLGVWELGLNSWPPLVACPRGKHLKSAPLGTPALPTASELCRFGPGTARLRIRRRPTRSSLIFIDCSGQSTVRRGFKGPFRERVRVWLTNSFREPPAGSSFLVPRPFAQVSHK